MWADGIHGISTSNPNMGKTPAMVGNESGIIFLNVEKLQNLSEDQIHSVINHERGHIQGKTSNEFKADAIGFENYAKSGRSLKASWEPLLKFLPFKTDEQYERLKKQVVRALIYDASHNGNKKALTGVEKILSDGNTGKEIQSHEILKNVERI